MDPSNKPFEPHSLLKNAHAMTIAAAYWLRRFRLPQAEDRLFQVDTESRLLARCHWQPEKRRDVPVLAIVHGLEGSSDSNYVMGVAERAFAAGFHVLRLNQRNCGGTEALTPTLYNSGMSADYRAVFEELSNADALERRDNFFYQRHFVTGLMARYGRKAKLFPERYSENGFGRIRTVREFDDEITAPQFGYRDAQEYYEAVGAKKLVSQVRVPMLMITAQDDPFVPYASFLRAKIAQNPAIRFLAPEHGGHCGFISKYSGAERFWAEQRIVDFCDEIRGAPP